MTIFGVKVLKYLLEKEKYIAAIDIIAYGQTKILNYSDKFDWNIAFNGAYFYSLA